MAAADWFDRLHVEKSELDERLGKLRSFMLTDACLSLPMADRVLLVRQEDAMSEYSGILAERINGAVQSR